MTQPENPMPMRPYHLVFSALDRDGNEVRLTESQWRWHILIRHSEVEPYLEEIKDVILDPRIVDIAGDGTYTYSRQGAVNVRERQYLVVVVTYSDEVTGRRLGSVRVAFLTNRRPKGQEVL